MPSGLTPTSYAVLGLLAAKPWTTYELTQQMHRVRPIPPSATAPCQSPPRAAHPGGLAARVE
jgi:PadR family transcriptional regulator, regulatory protein AphA